MGKEEMKERRSTSKENEDKSRCGKKEGRRRKKVGSTRQG